MPEFDVVIVGGGVAGGALGTRLARDGLGVLILERTLVHVDRIRGEAIVPWGVHEATQLGILDDLIAAVVTTTQRHLGLKLAFRSKWHEQTRSTCRR